MRLVSAGFGLSPWSLAHRAAHAGVPTEDDERQRFGRQILTTNVIALALTLAGVGWTPVFWYLGGAPWGLATLTMLGYGLIPLWNHKRWFRVSRLYMVFFGNGIVFVYGVGVGERSGMEILFLLTSAYTYLLFRREERAMRITALATPVVASGVLFAHYAQGIWDVTPLLHASAAEGVRAGLFYTTLILLLLVLVFFVTDSESSARRALAALSELERSNRDLSQFAYAASHDLQEPLRMVSSYTQLLAERYDGVLDGDGKDFIAFAVDGANRMQQLIQDLLAYSRVGSQGSELRHVEIVDTVDDAIANLAVAIAECRATITKGELPAIRGDKAQLTRVFQNLIGNALKFCDKEPPHVDITARRDGERWVISVSDNGPGIEERFRQRVFVIFQRLHSRAYPGTGIGLALCKRIIERHHGKIWLETNHASATGTGTRVSFSLLPG